VLLIGGVVTVVELELPPNVVLGYSDCPYQKLLEVLVSI
jgi:hypothetical protein